eukprot:m.143075 g.143075  ORF g.143075 m.143075 type:complete len:392 (+) comp17686_c0_seq9:198-1373(+)
MSISVFSEASQMLLLGMTIYNAGVLSLRAFQVDIGRLDDMNAAADTALIVYISTSLYLLLFFQGSVRAPFEMWNLVREDGIAFIAPLLASIDTEMIARPLEGMLDVAYFKYIRSIRLLVIPAIIGQGLLPESAPVASMFLAVLMGGGSYGIEVAKRQGIVPFGSTVAVQAILVLLLFGTLLKCFLGAMRTRLPPWAFSANSRRTSVDFSQYNDATHTLYTEARISAIKDGFGEAVAANAGLVQAISNRFRLELIKPEGKVEIGDSDRLYLMVSGHLRGESETGKTEVIKCPPTAIFGGMLARSTVRGVQKLIAQDTCEMYTLDHDSIDDLQRIYPVFDACIRNKMTEQAQQIQVRDVMECMSEGMLALALEACVFTLLAVGATVAVFRRDG